MTRPQPEIFSVQSLCAINSSRVRSKLPHQWQRSSSDQSIPEGHPGLKHANSAPMVRPATWSHLDPGPSYSVSVLWREARRDAGGLPGTDSLLL